MEHNHYTLDDIAEEIMINSRNELYLSMRFLDIPLSTLQIEKNRAASYLATEGEKLHYNPGMVIKKYEESYTGINRGYLHTLLHCIFRHMTNTEGKEEEEWNLACDIAVEHLIDGMEYKSVQRGIGARREMIYEELTKDMQVMTAEAVYYALMQKRMDYDTYLAWSNEFQEDDHTFWYQTKKEKNENNEQQNPDMDSKDNQKKKDSQLYLDRSRMQIADKWDKISDKLKMNLETYYKAAGTKTGDMFAMLQIEKREQYSYNEFLRRFARLEEKIKTDWDSFDYGYYHYGMQQYQNMPLIEPLEYKEDKMITEFVIVIDTSGSCGKALVKRFLEETYSILKDETYFNSKMNVHIMQCDERVQDDKKIENKEELEQYINQWKACGFGGTDFRPAFTYINKKLQNKEFTHLQGVLYFTDGYGIYPAKRPAYETAFVFPDVFYDTGKVPSWAMKVIL